MVKFFFLWHGVNCLGYKNTGQAHLQVVKFANLISKLNFYKLIPYPLDNSLSGRRRPARQTPEKDVLCFYRQVGP